MHVVEILIVINMNKKAFIITGLGVVVGLIAGYIYYQQVGCASGTCAITSKPLNSTLYGGLMADYYLIYLQHHLKRKKNETILE